MSPRLIDAPFSSPRRPKYEGAGHAIREFSHGVGLMAELETASSKLDISQLVESLVLALRGQAQAKPHPILYVNLALVITVVFWSGVLWNKVNTIEAKMAGVESIQVVSVKLDNLGQQVDRIEKQVDRMRDGGRGK